MSRQAKNFASILLPVLVSLGMLGGMLAEQGTHLTPEDAEPYHAFAKEVIEDYPHAIGYWMGADEHVTDAAVQLLRPNIILSRRYVNTQIGSRRSVGLLIVQCRDSRDMLGHYPPVCYVAHGETLVSQTPRDWEVDGMTITGVEYVFRRPAVDNRFNRIVYNFMVVPHVGIVRDMDGIGVAAKDYQQRYFGAAQFQLVMFGEIPREERDEIFASLIGSNSSIIKALISGEPEE